MEQIFTYRKFYFTVVISCCMIHTIAQTPTIIKDIVAGPEHAYITALQTIGDQAFFIADDGVNGHEVWRTDGTEAGTMMVKDINPGGFSVDYNTTFQPVNNIAYFVATDGEHGYELWKSDGTADGTMLVKDIRPDSYSSMDPNGFYDPWFTSIDNILYFSADDGVHGYELWRTDGTETGTYMVKDLVEGSGNSDIEYLTAAGDNVYFRAYDTQYNICLWTSDGTEPGTILLQQDLWVYSNDLRRARFFVEYNGHVYFPAGPDVYDAELWRTDGTPEGTELFFEFTTEESQGGEPSGLQVFNDKLIFTDDGLGNNFYVSDGTVDGTYILTDINGDDVTVSDNASFLPAGNKMYFSSAYWEDEIGYPGIWITDLTPGGTLPLASQEFAYLGSSVNTAASIGTNIIFKSLEEETGCYTLYQSNGTAAGTYLSVPCELFHYPDAMVELNGNFIIKAHDYNDVYGIELWLYNPEFTSSVGEKENAGFLMYPNPAHQVVVINPGVRNDQLSVTDGTGRTLLQREIRSSNESLDISTLSAGIYFIRYGGSVQRLIKQ